MIVELSCDIYIVKGEHLIGFVGFRSQLTPSGRVILVGLPKSSKSFEGFYLYLLYINQSGDQMSQTTGLSFKICAITLKNNTIRVSWIVDV